ncbi:Uncharacterised protein [Candidatus Anstonella stagnisolia]|nr:Uncharacterised protein [Candidatus Anstonella stagnisolia]
MSSNTLLVQGDRQVKSNVLSSSQTRGMDKFMDHNHVFTSLLSQLASASTNKYPLVGGKKLARADAASFVSALNELCENINSTRLSILAQSPDSLNTPWEAALRNMHIATKGAYLVLASAKITRTTAPDAFKKARKELASGLEQMATVLGETAKPDSFIMAQKPL